MARQYITYRVELSDGRTPGVDMPETISYEEWLELPDCDKDCFSVKVDSIEWRLNDD